MKGIIVFKGIGIGVALVHQEIEVSQYVEQHLIQEVQVESELLKMKSIFQQAGDEILKLKEHALTTVGEEEAEIFDAHMMMLEDPTLIDQISELIQKEFMAMDWATLKVRDDLVQQFMALENEYFQARANDVIDISDRLIRIYLGLKVKDLGQISEDTIIIAKDLKPSETVLLNKHVVGIVLEEGSITSHAAIVAKAKGIPTLVGVENACNLVHAEEQVILDAESGVFYTSPNQSLLIQYQELLVKQQVENKRIESLKEVDCITKDGHSIKLYGNVGSLQEAIWVKEQGGRGIGLLRTELIYMDSDHMPTEEEQFSYYKKIVELMPEETIIRTLDIGGDKNLPYYQLPHEENPFLGQRAIRLCLKEKDIFISQLKAILRASAYGKVKIMFPMISCLEELLDAKKVLEQAKELLKQKNIEFDEYIKVGIMIEIPSTAISADIFAKEVDFFSIGTNDLCQYTCAVDRMNPNVAYLYQPLHPSILKLIRMTVEAGREAQIEVGVCGEMAGDREFGALLMGMGVQELSMSPSMINHVKDKICTSTYTDLVKLAKNVQEVGTSKEAYKIVKGELLC